MERARLESLIHAQLDGELSAAERAELARELLQDADARRLHDDLARTDRLLREVPAADPPAGLREAILAGTARTAPPGRVAARPAFGSAYRIAAAFLGGLLIVGLAYVVSDGRGPATELQGSLGAAGTSVSLRSEGVAVDASLRRDGDTQRLEIRASAPRPCEVAVQFDPAATTFAGDAASTAADGEVIVRLPAGRQATVLEFSGAAPLSLELRADGRTLGSARLPLSGS
jgi:anti-sigma factor RsiW